MKTSLALAFATLAAVSAAQTTQTKVDLSLKGIAVKRTHAQAGRARSTKVSLTRGGVGITRTHAADPKAARAAAPDARSNIKVVVDGEPVAFQGQGPIMRNGSVLVPLRGVFEKMGASLDWDRAADQVTATRNGKTVAVKMGSATATVDGKPVTLNQPAILLNGRALVPLRFLSESFGAQVGWQPAQMTVTVTSGA